jgi:hypothetical protein
MACGAAAAQGTTKSFDPAAYPAGVRQVLQTARDACKAAGGGDVTFAPDTVRALDLTGGKHTDYIADLHNAVCQDREGVYCGSGGCEIDIVVTLPGGGMRTVFSQAVRDYDILPGSGPPRPSTGSPLPSRKRSAPRSAIGPPRPGSAMTAARWYLPPGWRRWSRSIS